jgi:hypothetical protein
VISLTDTVMSSQSHVDIQELEQELATAQHERDLARQECDEAINQATAWRQRYQTEAEQRRLETERYQQTIAQLQTRVRLLEHPSYSEILSSEEMIALEQQLNRLGSVEEIRFRLAEVLLEREKLCKALQTERAEHQQTRHSLTTALGDAIDTLGLYRKALPQSADKPALSFASQVDPEPSYTQEPMYLQ